MNDYGKPLRSILIANGCWFVRHGRGDHDIWRSPKSDLPFTVPVSIRSRHTANKILKDAGLPKAF
ncbi:addiction module toxin, HicA family protein [Kaistia sp. 32K]|uniref:type II toxin-antitoxin system HicA family toxin n=1 Tax=Kaistia sp. 32K TaxID=2795690 RepID=UPI0019155799|nr:type II toxin-antitoxin system HicA family toxin [Kaistia sp. 32K]BCP52903.1 addiction module toxin, HicA family protein [Kaistia sp. 32K]